jgi:hypothetical protein
MYRIIDNDGFGFAESHRFKNKPEARELIIQMMSDSDELPENYKELSLEWYLETCNFDLINVAEGKYCTKCNRELCIEEDEELKKTYKYFCHFCDENMFEFETHDKHQMLQNNSLR